MHILIIAGISRSLTNFRGPLIKAMLANGHKVTACAGTPLAEAEKTLREWGVKFIPVPIARAGMNPLGDLRTCRQLYRIMRQETPDAVFNYTIKPVIWGGFAAQLARVPHIYSLITGLGYAFMGKQTADCRPQTVDWGGETRLRPTELRRGKLKAEDSAAWLPSTQSLRNTRRDARQRMASCVAKTLYRISLKFSRKVFFQNPDDAEEFITRKLVAAHKTIVVSGSGVDLVHFPFLPSPRRTTAWSPSLQSTPETPNQPPKPSFLLIARLLADKGVREYAQAARMLKPAASFLLAGNLDPNPASISQTELDGWIQEETIEYLGYLDDVRSAYEQCSVYVLPSYREGTPRTVLEAMAMGRPIITTDAPGCRETVREAVGGEQLAVGSGRLAVNGQLCSPPTANRQPPTNIRIGANGILIPPRDAEALAEAMRFFIDNPDQIATMGHESRRYAEERYDVRKVNAVMLKEMGL